MPSSIAVTRLPDPASGFTIEVRVTPVVTVTNVAGRKVSFAREVQNGDIWTVTLLDGTTPLGSASWSVVAGSSHTLGGVANVTIDTAGEIAAYLAEQIDGHDDFTARAVGTNVLIASLNNLATLDVNVSIDPILTQVSLAITDVTIEAGDFEAGTTYTVTIGSTKITGIAAGANVGALRTNLRDAIEGHADYSASLVGTDVLRIIKVVDGSAMGAVEVLKSVVTTDVANTNASQTGASPNITYQGFIDFPPRTRRTSSIRFRPLWVARRSWE